MAAAWGSQAQRGGLRFVKQEARSSERKRRGAPTREEREGGSKSRKKARQPRGPRGMIHHDVLTGRTHLLGASRYSRHRRGPRRVAALLCTRVRRSARWGPPETAGLEGTGPRWADEGLTAEPRRARRSGQGRGACDLSGPGSMRVLGARRHPCGQGTAERWPDKHAGRAGGCGQRAGSLEFGRAAFPVTGKARGACPASEIKMSDRTEVTQGDSSPPSP